MDGGSLRQTGVASYQHAIALAVLALVRNHHQVLHFQNKIAILATSTPIASHLVVDVYIYQQLPAINPSSSGYAVSSLRLASFASAG